MNNPSSTAVTTDRQRAKKVSQYKTDQIFSTLVRSIPNFIVIYIFFQNFNRQKNCQAVESIDDRLWWISNVPPFTRVCLCLSGLWNPTYLHASLWNLLSYVIYFSCWSFFVKRRNAGRCLGVRFLAWLQPRNYHFIKCSGGSTSISYIHDSLQSVMACKKGRILMSVCVKCFLLDCHLTIVRWTEF